MLRRIHINTGPAIVYLRHTPSMVVNNTPQTMVVQGVTAHRPCIIASYANRHKTSPLLRRVTSLAHCTSLPVSLRCSWVVRGIAGLS